MIKYMKKKTTALAALCFVMVLSGCGQNGQTEAKNTAAFEKPRYEWGGISGEKLVIWGIYPEMERSYITKAFERYQAFTNNELEIVQIPKEEFEQQVLASVAGEMEKPDILLSYGGTNIEAYCPDENFYDFSDAVWVDDLTDTSINQTIYNGKVIGLPHWEASVSGTLYNKEIFKKYHLEIPKTQEEFMQVCETLQQNGITPLYMPGKEISMLLYQFPMDHLVEDTDILNGLNDGTLGYDSLPQMKEIVNWYKTMAKKGYLGETYRTDDWNGMSKAMDSGEYAMMLCWDTWLYTDFTGDASKFGIMPAFVGVPDEGTFEGPNLGLFIVNKNSERLGTALDFISFLADPYNYNVVFEGIYTAPVFKNQVASISTPQYLEAERLIDRHYHDSTAWLRIRGFSQMDASCILEYMDAGEEENAEECLKRMESLRQERLKR